MGLVTIGEGPGARTFNLRKATVGFRLDHAAPWIEARPKTVDGESAIDQERRAAEWFIEGVLLYLRELGGCSDVSREWLRANMTDDTWGEVLKAASEKLAPAGEAQSR